MVSREVRNDDINWFSFCDLSFWRLRIWFIFFCSKPEYSYIDICPFRVCRYCSLSYSPYLCQRALLCRTNTFFGLSSGLDFFKSAIIWWNSSASSFPSLHSGPASSTSIPQSEATRLQSSSVSLRLCFNLPLIIFSISTFLRLSFMSKSLIMPISCGIDCFSFGSRLGEARVWRMTIPPGALESCFSTENMSSFNPPSLRRTKCMQLTALRKFTCSGYLLASPCRLANVTASWRRLSFFEGIYQLISTSPSTSTLFALPPAQS